MLIILRRSTFTHRLKPLEIVLVMGSGIYSTNLWQFNGCGSYGGAFVIVPPGATYQLNSGQGVYNWAELY